MHWPVWKSLILLLFYFTSVYTPSKNRDMEFNLADSIDLPYAHIKSEEIFQYFMSLDVSKRAGADGVPPVLLKS